MMRRLKHAWRTLRGRCVLCGTRRPATFVAHDLHTHGPYCRRCNKTFSLARLFGGGERAIRRIIEGDRS